MPLLDALVYFCDRVCTSPYASHMAAGVFFGFLIGFAHPKRAFWAAFGIGFSKEVIDYFKHTTESAQFNFLTDPKYGLYDGYEDLLFWMIGGYIAYRLLEFGHKRVLEQHKKQLDRSLILAQNPADQQVSDRDSEISAPSIVETVISAESALASEISPH